MICNNTTIYLNASENSFHQNQVILNSISNFFGFYVIPITSGFGFFINVLIFILLCSKNLTHQFYRYFQCKTTFDIIYSIIGIGFQNAFCPNCLDTLVNTKEALIYHFYGVILPTRIFYMCSSCMNIFLTINRIGELSVGEKNPLQKISAKILFLLISLASVCVFLPYFFIYEFPQLDRESTTMSNLSDFGKKLSKIF